MSVACRPVFFILFVGFLSSLLLNERSKLGEASLTQTNVFCFCLVNDCLEEEGGRGGGEGRKEEKKKVR